MNYRDEDDKERDRPSWREIDALRDGTKKREVQKPLWKPNYQKQREESLAKKALEDLFQGKKSKEQEAEWKKVCDGSGKNFSARASGYVEKHGLPRQWDDLLRLLDHRDPLFVDQVLDKLSALAAAESRAKLDLLHGKLRILKMEREEPQLLEKMDRILADLAGRL
jgi:hypothetical protein